jgi:hypothetical protein
MAGTGISFHNETVQVLTAVAATDRYGNQALTWDAPVVTDVPGCRVLPVPGPEVLDRVTTKWMLFAPPDTALVSANRVRWNGTTYDVVGDVRRWPSPTGRMAHIEADLARVEG